MNVLWIPSLFPSYEQAVLSPLFSFLLYSVGIPIDFPEQVSWVRPLHTHQPSSLLIVSGYGTLICGSAFSDLAFLSPHIPNRTVSAFRLTASFKIVFIFYLTECFFFFHHIQLKTTLQVLLHLKTFPLAHHAWLHVSTLDFGAISSSWCHCVTHVFIFLLLTLPSRRVGMVCETSLCCGTKGRAHRAPQFQRLPRRCA